MLQLYDRDDRSPRFQRFRQAYEQQFKEPPGFGSVAGYDTAVVLLVALAGQTPPDGVKAALLTRGPYEGLQQRIAFDANGDAVRRHFFVVVRDGRFATIT